MSLSVSPCGNRKTWDARVRVTGGHPELLWGIGEAEALTRDDVSVERVAVNRGDQTVGYGQLIIHPEDHHTVVDAKSLHVKNPRDLVPVLSVLQEHARSVHQAAVLRANPDTRATVELAEQLTAAGYRRRAKPRRGEAGPRHLIVRLGETEGQLSKRLSSGTLQRCRDGLRDSGIRVRRVDAADRDLSHVGLRTQHIRELLRGVGDDSVFLVATERLEDGGESALGYLWFVHTGESAMIYRSGFTDRARQLGVDDALLLTGLVQLQQRQVHKVLAGDPDQPGQPVVLRELATEDQEVLGTWEFPLVGEFQMAGRAEKTRRRLFGRRRRSPERILPGEVPGGEAEVPAPHPAGGAADGVGVSRSGRAAGAAGDELATVTPIATAVEGTPGSVPPEEADALPEDGAAEVPVEESGSGPGAGDVSPEEKRAGGTAGARPRRKARVRREQPAAVEDTPREPLGSADSADPTQGSSSQGLLRRAVAEARAAVLDAARW